MFRANHAPNLLWHLHCLQTDRNKIPHDPCHFGLPSGASKMISEPVVRSVRTVHLSCIKFSIISKWTESSMHSSLSLRNTIGCVENDFWANGMFGQTMDLSCIKITTITKRTELSFHLSLITYEYHRVCPKWFLSQWNVWHQPCTYLALKLTLTPNATSIMLGANRAPILHKD
jgi:hypothetical protein